VQVQLNHQDHHHRVVAPLHLHQVVAASVTVTDLEQVHHPVAMEFHRDHQTELVE
jgi:hypothetical protein